MTQDNMEPTARMVTFVTICHFHVSVFGRNSRDVHHGANDEI